MLEKVKCWVNPYEIIATGNNVGIIECVPNAISVDQLKRKIGINSLSSFYETNFGPRKSKSKI
jgi:phosphatidylinositol kinase/protein kinase (PI-3  family)